MRIIKNILIFILLLGFAAVAVTGAMIEFPTILGYNPERIHQLGRSFLEVMRPGNLLFWCWIGVIAALLFIVLISVFGRRKQMRIEVQMGGGRVVILDSAIKRYIRSALAEIPDVTTKRIDLRETRGGLQTDIYADVKTQESLPVLERRMIQRVRAALAEDLGITSISDVHVFIRDFEVSGRRPHHAGKTHGRESETEESDPAVRINPRPTTGPFDQVPAPDFTREVERPGSYATLRGDESPRAPGAALAGASAAAMAAGGTSDDEKSSLQADEPFAPYGAGRTYDDPEQADADAIILPSEDAPAGVAEETSASSEEPEPKRGFFGKWGRGSEKAPSDTATDESSATAAIVESEPEKVDYDPVTTTESVEAETAQTEDDSNEVLRDEDKH